VIVWLIRRLIQAAFVIFAVTIIVFLGVHLIGNPVDILIPPGADQAERARAIAALGFDKPLSQQYLIFLDQALHGSLGTSYVYAEPALRLIAERLPATFELTLLAMLLSVLLGLPLGLYTGLHPESIASRIIMGASVIGFCLPSFWVGLMLIMVFSVQLGWLPSSGRGATAMLFGVPWSFLTLSGLRQLVLPALNLALFNIAMMLRLTHAGVCETMPMDFIKFARAKGLAPRRIVGVHVLKTILIPIITMLGMQFGSTMAYAVVTETVFAWPGTGKLIIDSINVLDRPVIVAHLMIIALLFTLINLVVDVLYSVLDPRVRLGGDE
jgi:peptide/nickel transport system permease protein